MGWQAARRGLVWALAAVWPLSAWPQSPVVPPPPPVPPAPATPPVADMVKQLPPTDVETTQEKIEFYAGRSLLLLKGKVTVKYSDVVLLAQEVTLHTDTYDFSATGGVELTRGELHWRGDALSGNLKARTFVYGQHEVSYGIWQVRGEQSERAADGLVTVAGARLTTCDDWWLESDKLTLKPDGDFRAESVVVRVFGVPVFYMPHMTGNIHEDRPSLQIAQGYKSSWGYFLRLSRPFPLNRQVTVTPLVEVRTSRGVALGAETTVKTDDSRSKLLLYGQYDSNPLHNLTVGDEEYNDRFKAETERYRVRLEHRTNLTEHLTLRADADARSDRDLLFEFFGSEFRDDPQPASRLDLSYDAERLYAGAELRSKLNYFENVVERLPELRVTTPRHPLADLGVHYQGHTDGGYLRMNWRDYDLPRPGVDPLNYESLRLDSTHVLTYPLELGGWLHVLPRAGFRFTAYDQSSERRVTAADLATNLAASDYYSQPTDPVNAIPYDDNGGSRGRFAGELGLELNFKAYQTWQQARSEFWQIDGVRHVVEPYVNYTWLSEPTVDKDYLYFFDPTDRLDQANFVRVGTRQRFQTRRDLKIMTFARVENYVDFHFDPDAGQAQAGDFGHIFELEPRDFLSFSAKVLLDGQDFDMKVFQASTRLGPADQVNVALYYLLRDDFQSRYVNSLGSDLTEILATNGLQQDFSRAEGVGAGLNVPVSTRDWLRLYYYYDLEAGRLATQSYTWERTVRCWVLSLRAQEDYGIWGLYFLVYLRQLPGVRLGTGG